MKRKALPVILAIGVFFLIFLGIAAALFLPRYIPTSDRSNLREYYGATGENEAGVIFNFMRSEIPAKEMEGAWYLEYNFVKDNIDKRFYWDDKEEILRYTNARSLVSVEANDSIYTTTSYTMASGLGAGDGSISTEDNDFGKTIIRLDMGGLYLSLDFVQQYTNLDFKVTVGNPPLIVIESGSGPREVAQTRRNVAIRERGGIKSPITADVPRGTEVVITEVLTNWAQVATPNGEIGYLRMRDLQNGTSIVVDRIGPPDQDFTHVRMDKEVSMGWHVVSNQTVNSFVASVLSSAPTMNVISPTWFYLNDNDGNLMNLSSRDYVNTCHQNNVQVWGLVSNFENPSVDTTYVLTHTSIRDNLTEEMIRAALACGMDGINLDFEDLSQAVGDSYIQWVREIALRCRAVGLTISVCNYVPMPHTALFERDEQAFFTDYIVVMAYDEFFSSSPTAGSVGSIPWVRTGIVNTMNEVPENQIVLGMPFYTRIWQTDDAGAVLRNPAVSMMEAQRQVAEAGAEIIWREDTGQNYAEWTRDGVNFQVWLEDAESIEERFKLMEEFELGGAAYWRLGFETPDIWEVVGRYID